MSIKKSSKLIIAGIAILIAAVIIAAIATPAFAKQSSNGETRRAVPFSEVNVDEGFMHNYMKLVICKVIPTAIEQVEYFNPEKKECGGIYNIKHCALWHEGKEARVDHLGALYVDSDVHKVLESMCMALDTPAGGDQDIIEAQTEIKKTLDEWIPWYQWAPEQNGDYKGYFDSYWSLDEGHEKYSNTDQHELYCQGHFIEAAVAHYRYAVKKDPGHEFDLLNVAINSADHIVATFGEGPNQRKQIPGHQEIELALMKLAKLCQEIGGEYADKAPGYINEAAFFLGVRGDYNGRTVDDDKEKRQYYQDHALVENQMEGVGHAVRAQYMYTGMAELASIDPTYASKYDLALRTLWDNVTNKKQYITGGIGDQSNNNEGFADNYFLPNYGSYCETCAGVANMLWNRSMSILYDGSQYADQIETDLYNNILGCVNFDGDRFYYENRICTSYAFQRSEWFGTACCPPNFTRTILQVGGYIYNTSDTNLYINQYITNKANFKVGEVDVNVDMDSGFPYDSTGTIKITPTTATSFAVQLRKPYWTDGYTIKVNGQPITTSEQNGYLIISGQTWAATGTEITFDFNMPLKYEKADEHVQADIGYTALRHGPILYCAEGIDNDSNFNYYQSQVNMGGSYNFEEVTSLDGKDDKYGVRGGYVLNHEGTEIVGSQTKAITWKLIPYYARTNRDGAGSMHLFLHDGSQTFKTHQKAIPTASFTGPTDDVKCLNDGVDEKQARWTSYNGDDVLPNPWVRYDFDKPVSFNGFKIWWYDDNGGVRLPDGFKFEVYNSQTDSYESVDPKTLNVKEANDSHFNVYEFPTTYTADQIKLTVFNTNKNKAVGIVEWELMDATPQPPTPDPVDPGNSGTPKTGDNAWLAFAALMLLAVAFIATRKLQIANK